MSNSIQPESGTTPTAPRSLPDLIPVPAVPVIPPVESITPVPAVSADPDRDATSTDSDILPEADLDSEDVAWLNVTEIDELAQCVNTCVEHWWNTGPEARKKMFSLFAVAGIFLAVCRHGHVLVICDMIRSGEL